MGKKIVAAVLLTLLAQPASARDWPSLQDWNFAEGADFCEMMTTYGEEDDEANLSLILMPEGRAAIGATSKFWAMEKDKSYEIHVVSTAGDENEGSVTGYVEGEEKGFILMLEPAYLDEIVASEAFKFHVPGTETTGDFNIADSDRAYTQLKTCLGELEAAAKAS